MPLSTVDWPDQLVATVFTQGCPWDCAYCHNPHLIPFGDIGTTAPAWEDVLRLLESRVGLLDGVVFTGGEPTAQAALTDAMRAVRGLGLAVALHTGGPSPSALERALVVADWVGFDVKAPFGDYQAITGVAGSGERARESLALVVASGVPYEVRTTVHGGLLGEEALDRLADELEAAGVSDWVLQPFRPQGARPVAPAAGLPDLARYGERHTSRFRSLTVR